MDALTGTSRHAFADNTHRRRKAFLDAVTDSFRFDDVDDGVYSLDVEAPPYVFSAVKVTVENGVVKEALASDVGNVRLPVDQGLRMVPLRVTQYFEQRGKFSLWAFLKTPYGAMIFFALCLSTGRTQASTYGMVMVCVYALTTGALYQHVRNMQNNNTGGTTPAAPQRERSDFEIGLEDAETRANTGFCAL